MRSLTLGREPQTFLGAGWVQWLFERSPASKKRLWAFRLLSLSPHYFLDRHSPENRVLSSTDYYEKAADDWLNTRKRFFEEVLEPRLTGTETLLDYGCGPGFLAATLARHYKEVFACDISAGAIACAKVLNPSENLRYLIANEEGLSRIEDGSLDAIVSVAVVQHLGEKPYKQLLEACYKKLRPDGSLLLHVQLDEGNWQSEDDWKNDGSFKGRLKYDFGLHCFGRSADSHRNLLASAGFTDIRIEAVSEIVSEPFDDICAQHLLSAVKA